jgi:hypothetical protein
MNTFSFCLAIAIAALPIRVHACSPPPLDESEVRDATAVLVGYVTAERHPQFESLILAGRYPDPLESSVARALPASDRIVRVAFSSSLHGELRQPVELEVACASPGPRAFDRVVVVFSKIGLPQMFSSGMEPYIREILRGGG